ncbi:MAG: GIY-YIG nuclease family protein [Omnitrophica bacterium]|nr:GIY-YIG nuclease family protein [Candidatus Omnitrophota bacterium]
MSYRYKRYIYVGSTNNLKRRLSEHNSKKSRLATAPYQPLRLMGYIAVKSEEKARKLETYFKGGSGKAFLKKRILPDEVHLR